MKHVEPSKCLELLQKDLSYLFHGNPNGKAYERRGREGPAGEWDGEGGVGGGGGGGGGGWSQLNIAFHGRGAGVGRAEGGARGGGPGDWGG